MNYSQDWKRDKAEVVVLPNRLRLAKLSRERLPQCMHAILQILFIVESNSNIFSYTETSDEISLILELDHVAFFPTDALEMGPHVWRVLQLAVGQQGFQASGVISALAGPLADAKLTIFQLSTYESDLALVPEDSLPVAIEILRPYFRINARGYLPVESVLSDPLVSSAGHASHRHSSTAVTPATRHSSGTNGDQQILSHTRRSYNLLPPNIVVASVQKHMIFNVAQPLLRTMFYPESLPSDSNSSSTHGSISSLPGIQYPSQSHSLSTSVSTKSPESAPQTSSVSQSHSSLLYHSPVNQSGGLAKSTVLPSKSHRFFSISYAGMTCSLFIEAKDAQFFPEDSLNIYGDRWKLLQVDFMPLGFDEAGIVKDFTEPLGKNDISIYYMSTFLTDYIIVSQDDMNDAVQVLDEVGIQLNNRDQLEKSRTSTSGLLSYPSTLSPSHSSTNLLSTFQPTSSSISGARK